MGSLSVGGMTSKPRKPRPEIQRLYDVAAGQADVVSRRQAYALGVTRGEVRAHVRARRWQRVRSQSIVLHTGPLADESRWWAAVFEGGPRAHLDAASSLLASGLEHWTEDSIRVSVPKGARLLRSRPGGLNIRETRRFDPTDIVPTGVPRSRPAVAALRAGLWARSDRAAVTLVTMAVQQGLCSVEELAVELLRIRRDRRRRLLHELVLELAGGVRALGELDVVRGCRQRGLPVPDRQVVRRTPSGRYYLDLRWQRWRLVVEVDGIHHAWVQNVVPDAVRHNAVALSGDLVLRVPVLGLRVCPDQFFDQIEEGLARRGWTRGTSCEPVA